MTVPEAAALFGSEPAWIVAQLDEVAVPQPEQGIPWSEIALLVREIFTPAELDAVAESVPGFPNLLRVSSVKWRLPAYLLMALDEAVAAERALNPAASRLTVEAFVARHLSMTLDSEIFDRLSDDPTFREAVEFPEEDE
jgi:hypothetical protein